MAKKTSKKRLHSGKRAVRKVVRRTASKKRGGKIARGKGGGGAAADNAAELSAVIAKAHGVALAHHAREALVWTHRMTLALLRDWPGERLTFQTTPTDNHALWTVGHLATAYAWFASLIDGQMTELPDGYQQMFGYGSKPVSDPNAYPPMNEVLSVHERAFERVLSAFDGLAPDEVVSPVAGDAHGVCQTRVEVMYRLAWHEGWHQGQLASLRKALGLPNVM